MRCCTLLDYKIRSHEKCNCFNAFSNHSRLKRTSKIKHMEILQRLPLDIKYTILKMWFVFGCNSDNWNIYFSAGIPLNWFRFADLDWNIISQQTLPIEFISQFEDLLNWKIVTSERGYKREFPERFLNRHLTEICWDHVSSYKSLSISFLRINKDQIAWRKIMYQRLDLKTMKILISEFEEYIDWTRVAIQRPEIKLDENFILQHIDQINLTEILDSLQRSKLSDICIVRFQDRINFQKIYFCPFSDDLVVQLEDKICWEHYSRFCKSEMILKKYSERIDWKSWSSAERTEGEIDKNKKRLSWKHLCTKVVLTDGFFKKYKKYIDWDALSKNLDWSESLLCKYFEKVNFEILNSNFLYLHIVFNYSLGFLRKYISKVGPGKILCCEKLPEKICDEYHSKWSTEQWISLSKNPNLSEYFIRKYQEKLEWRFISKNCNPTTEFVLEFELKIIWPEIMENKRLSKSTKLKFLERLQKLGRIE